MNCWPLQLAVIAFPDGALPAGVADQLHASRANGVIRVIDGASLAKGEEGEIEVRAIRDLALDDSPLAGKLAEALFRGGADEAPTLCRDQVRAILPATHVGFGLSVDDLAEIVDGIPRASIALVLLIEHRWNAGFAESVAVDRGTILAQGWITPTTVRDACGMRDGFDGVRE